MGMGVLCLNVILMLVKIGVGTVGNSYALIADGVESASDIFVSLIAWGGFMLSLRPADDRHPFGHGKIESLAGMFSGVFLLVAATGISIFSIREILNPQEGPAWFTLPVLLLVVLLKEWLYRKVQSMSSESRSLEGDAWHHRADAMTSAAAALGITIALVGGEGFAAADDWAALFACGIIAFNGWRILSNSLHDTLDGQVESGLITALTDEAENHSEVYLVETCRVRKSGIGYFVELHLWVDENMTVRAGHQLGHEVKDRLQHAFPHLHDVVIHLEPHDKNRRA
jgi:cation diffusion facilitator family transporter